LDTGSGQPLDKECGVSLSITTVIVVDRNSYAFQTWQNRKLGDTGSAEYRPARPKFEFQRGRENCFDALPDQQAMCHVTIETELDGAPSNRPKRQSVYTFGS